jgi:hypothetical protein
VDLRRCCGRRVRRAVPLPVVHLLARVVAVVSTLPSARSPLRMSARRDSYRIAP